MSHDAKPCITGSKLQFPPCRFVLPKSFVIQDPPYLFCYTAPHARLRTQTSCIRDPNSILVFFQFLSYLTCLFIPSFG